MGRERLDRFEPAPELVSGNTKRCLRLDVQVTGNVDDGEQEVAELVVDAITISSGDGIGQLTGLFSDLR